MHRLAIIPLLLTLILASMPVHSRTGPDNALGIDPARVDEIVNLIEPFDMKLLKNIRRVLPFVSIRHGFRVRGVHPGPVTGLSGLDGRAVYHPYLDLSGTSGGGGTEKETGRKETFRFHFENPVIASIKTVEQDHAETSGMDQPPRSTVEKIVRLTYDFVLAFDDDTRDHTSYKIVMPMDVTIHGEAVHGPRAGDGCVGWWSEYRLLEVSYGPLQLITMPAG